MMKRLDFEGEVKKMNKLSEKLMKFYLSIRYAEKGATAVEYALMVALIAVVIITAVTLLGTNIASRFTTIANKIGP